MEDKYLYKLVDNVLIGTKTTKEIFVEGNYYIVEKTPEELQGYKELIRDSYGGLTEYQIQYSNYVEQEDKIIETIHVKEKPISEIIEINKKFWSDNYYTFAISETEVYFAPKKTLMGGETFDLLQDDLPIMLAGAMSTQLVIGSIQANPELTESEKIQQIIQHMSLPSTFSYMDMYMQPDYTQKLTSTYIDTLKIRINDQLAMTKILGLMASMLYANRELPVLGL